MAKTEKQKTVRWQVQRPLLAVVLAAAGIFNMASAVFAAGTAADTPIRNTATATYEDDNNNPFNATSNEVLIRVAEVAGLTVVVAPIEDSTPGTPVEPGDTVTFPFVVTNTGNAPTNVFVPGINNIPTTNFVPSPTDPVQVFEIDGTTLIGTIAPGGELVTNGGTPVVFAPDEQFIVKVSGTPSPTAADGDTIDVSLGNTADNPTTEGTDQTQNQSDDDDAGTNADDLRTVDPTPGDLTDDPVNGEREASAVSATTLDASPLALAKILKNSAIADQGIPSNPADDLITYTLELDVDDVDPSGTFQPADLEGTAITVDGATVTRILVSDAIPDETRLNSAATPAPGWTAVYGVGVNDAVPGSDALGIDWQTAVPTTPAELAAVNRVGFIFDGTIAQGTAIPGFEFTVITSGVTSTTGTTIENVAQVFGETVGDPTDQIIYDESGDNNPNNFDGTTPPDPDGSDYTPGTPGTPGPNDGIAPESDPDGDLTPNNPGDLDPGGNTGTSPDGDINVVVLIPAVDSILNGPQDIPAATGPSGGDEDDFTNKSTPTPAGLAPTDTFDPPEVEFDNSFNNPGADLIANTRVEPLSPSEAAAASGLTSTQAAAAYGNNADIPVNTTVTISDGVDDAIYTFNGSTFNLTTGTPIAFGDVAAGDEVDYTVTVDLPGTVLQLDEVSIPLVAFPDTNAVGFDGETANNITVDRLYTGFMRLRKESEISRNGAVVEAFTETPSADAQPGDVITYRLTYENISTPDAGAGNTILNANNFVILEDGNAGTNTWAPVTEHLSGATAAAGSEIRYYTNSTDATPAATSPADPPDGTLAEKYENAVPTVAPGTTGTFTFRREVL
ncbi:MAG: hypothetical protein AAFV90_07985 [Cyanobacteria bacterium J06634_5]